MGVAWEKWSPRHQLYINIEKNKKSILNIQYQSLEISWMHLYRSKNKEILD